MVNVNTVAFKTMILNVTVFWQERVKLQEGKSDLAQTPHTDSVLQWVIMYTHTAQQPSLMLSLGYWHG